MSTFLDTSVIVRYLIGSPQEMFERARAIIDGEEPLQVTGVALAETAFVLTSFYHLPRQVVVDRLIEFVQKGNIRPYALDKATVTVALQLCRPSGRVAFSDALIWAAARSAGPSIVYSFDRRFPADGIELRRSGEAA